MLLAVLDLGTNTFHLLLAVSKEGHIKIRARYKFTVHLGKEAAASSWYISDEAQQRALEALQFFADQLRKAAPERVVCVATAAFRMDPRGRSIAAHLAQKTGLPIQVISGEEEAELIYQGVRKHLHSQDNSFLIDIGGGSTECSIGTSRQCLWKRSFDLGAQLLMNAFFDQDPMPLQKAHRLRRHLGRLLDPIFPELSLYKPRSVLGTSGSFTTLYSMYMARYEAQPLDECSKLTISQFRSLYEPLLHLPRAERLKLPGMSKSRVDMIVMSAYIIDLILDRYDFEEVMVSNDALKEGLLERQRTDFGGTH